MVSLLATAEVSDTLKGSRLIGRAPVIIDGGVHPCRVLFTQKDTQVLRGKLVDIQVMSSADVSLKHADEAFRLLAQNVNDSGEDLNDELDAEVHASSFIVLGDGTGSPVVSIAPTTIVDGDFAMTVFQVRHRRGHASYVPHRLWLPEFHHGPRSNADIVFDLFRSGRIRIRHAETPLTFFRSDEGTNMFDVIASHPIE